jgi:hypothetical protein
MDNAPVTAQLELSSVPTGDARRSTERERDAVWTRARVVVAAIGVYVALLGAQLGLQLRLPGATPSVRGPRMRC